MYLYVKSRCYYENDNDCNIWNKCLENYLNERNLNDTPKNEDKDKNEDIELQYLFISDIFTSELHNRNMDMSKKILEGLGLNNEHTKQCFIESLKPFIRDLAKNLGIFTSDIIINSFDKYLQSFKDKLVNFNTIFQEIDREKDDYNKTKKGNPIEIIKKFSNFQTLSIWNNHIINFKTRMEQNENRWIIFINLANIVLNNILNNSYGLNETFNNGGSSGDIVLNKYNKRTKKRTKKRSKKRSKKRKPHKSRKSRKLHRR